MASDVSPSDVVASDTLTPAHRYQKAEASYWADAVEKRGLLIKSVPTEIRLVVEQEVLRRTNRKLDSVPLP